MVGAADAFPLVIGTALLAGGAEVEEAAVAEAVDGGLEKSGPEPPMGGSVRCVDAAGVRVWRGVAVVVTGAGAGTGCTGVAANGGPLFRSRVRSAAERDGGAAWMAIAAAVSN